MAKQGQGGAGRKGGNAPRRDGRRDQGGKGRGPRGGSGGKGQQPKQPSLEYVLVRPEASLAAEVSAEPYPLTWREIPTISLLPPGLYLRYKGSLQSVVRELSFERATLYALWDDEHYLYHDGRQVVQPGLRAAFLVKTPWSDGEGPPYLPIDASLADSIDAWDDGLLSSRLDPVHCTPFKATLHVAKRKLEIASAQVLAGSDEDRDAPLLETLRWLANNPESEHPAAVTARTMLVDQGHGLQRAGVLLMHSSSEVSTELMDTLLPTLSPEIAPLLRSVYHLWNAEGEEQRAAFVELAKIAAPIIQAGKKGHKAAGAQRRDAISVLVTWLTGIFGSRPDRQLLRPARSLFAALRFLRDSRMQPDALEHPDANLPTFPLSHAASAEIVQALGFVPDDESELESVVRALAVGESARDFGRPTLQHLRPFYEGFPNVRNYPVASRTLLGRFDGLITNWSFRGRDVDSPRVTSADFIDNLIFERTTWASSRAYARILGARRAVASALHDALQADVRSGPPNHPDLARIAALADRELSDVVDELGKATRARRPNNSRVLDAVAGHEFMVARLQRDKDIELDWEPIAPSWDGADEAAAVRRHFMYWRAYCRSVLDTVHESYARFLDEAFANHEELSWKMENEVFALLRQWSQFKASDLEKLEGWRPHLEARLATIVTESSAGDERVFSLVAALAKCGLDAWWSAVQTVLSAETAHRAELHRMLDLARRESFVEDLREGGQLAALHEKLSADEGTNIQLARIEWTRLVTELAQSNRNIRWLLFRDDWHEITFSDAFSSWFRDEGPAALGAPDDAIIALLELAAREVNRDDIVTVMQHLDARTTWPTSEKVRMLLDAGRAPAAARWLATAAGRSAEDIEAVVRAALPEAERASELHALTELVQSADCQAIAISDAVRAELRDAVAAHESHPSLHEAAGHQLAAYRVVGEPGGSEDRIKLARDAVRRFLETRGDDVFAKYIGYAVEKQWLEEYGEELRRGVQSDAGAEHLLRLLADAEWPPELLALVREYNQLEPSHPARRFLTRALVSLDTAQLVGAHIDVAIVEAAQRDIEATRAALTTLVNDEVVAEPASSEEASASDSSDAEETRAERTARRLASMARENLAKMLKAQARFWLNALEGLSSLSAEGCEPLIAALRFPSVRRMELARDIIARAGASVSAAGYRVLDPRRVVGNALIRFSLDGSPGDLEALVAFLIAFAQEQSAAKAMTLERDGLSVDLREPADEGTDDSGDEQSADESNADNGAENDGEDAEGAGDDTDEGDDDDAEGDSLPSRLRRALKGKASPEERSALFGSPLFFALVMRLVERNENFALRVRQGDKYPRLQLSWERPRQRKGGRRSGKGRR